MEDAVRAVFAAGAQDRGDERFSPEQARAVQTFHKTIPGYEPTPLRNLRALAEELGLGAFYVKDESPRFGLNAFKSLGGSYAVARVIARRAGLPPVSMSYEALTADRVRSAMGRCTFATATDGNHGRGVAWAAKRFGHAAVVYLPSGSAPERVGNIRALGAEAEVTDWDYDETVRYASARAAEEGWILVQDTAWPGYEEIPLWIMQGYLTMGAELIEQLPAQGPTHVFLQAGVGSMAAAMAAWIRQVWPVAKIALVEPCSAACCYLTALADDGKLHTSPGPMHSMMAGLCCGTPSTIAWEILHRTVDGYFTLPDHSAAFAMRALGNPLLGDAPVVSGESGAAGAGLLMELMTDAELAPYRDALGLGRDSRCLVLSTEGDTDRKNYRRVIWRGIPCSPEGGKL